MDFNGLWSLIRQLQGALGGNRIVRGGVTSAGDVGSGVDFSVVKNGTGDYSVTFDAPLRTIPSVVVGAGGTAAFISAKLSALTPVSAAGFRVLVFVTDTTTATDGEFHFIAAG